MNETAISADIFDIIKPILRDHLEVDPILITMGAILEDLNADSLDIIEIVMKMEERFDIKIPDEDGEDLNTVKDLVDVIVKELMDNQNKLEKEIEEAEKEDDVITLLKKILSNQEKILKQLKIKN